MNGLIQELVNDIRTNENLKGSIVMTMVLESIENSKRLGVSDSEIFESSIALLEKLAKEMTNSTLHEVVAKFKKMAQSPTAKLQNMASAAGLKMKLKSISESSIAGDPVAIQKIRVMESHLAKFPEFKVIGAFFEAFVPYSYDKVVAENLENLAKYCDANSSKLQILNSIYEMRVVSSTMYAAPCSILEEALLENITTCDSLGMKLRNHKGMPIVSKLLNSLAMNEAKELGKFNIGTGSGETRVDAVIAPFYKVSENNAIIFVDNSFVKVSETEDPAVVSNDEVLAESSEFFKVCESFSMLGFKQKGSILTSTNGKNKVGFEVNEKGNLNLYVNGKVVENISSINYSDLFLMENMQVRHALNTLFENIDYVVNAEFGKRLVNERLDKETLVFNFDNDVHVFERNGLERKNSKLTGLAFYAYVLENYNYDVSELYSIQLEERAQALKKYDSEKEAISENIAKLEASLTKIDEALNDKAIDQANKEKLNELRVAIEKNVNQLKNQYVLIDQAKKNS